jgi:hypothetical protein
MSKFGSVIIKNSEETRTVEVTNRGEILTSSVYRLVGTTFNGTVDENFWTPTVVVGGTVTFDGLCLLTNSTDSTSEVSLNSVRKARFVPGSANIIIGLAKISAPVTGNTRSFGAYDDDNGFFFQVSGTTFSVVSRKATSNTVVASGSFNGDYGTTAALMTNVVYKFGIEYGTAKAEFYINDILVHTLTVKAAGGTLVKTLTLPIRVESINTTSILENSIELYNTSIFRRGQLQTSSTYKYIVGAATNILKRSAGNLHRIVIQDASGNATIYDGTDDTGILIADIDLTLGTLEFGLDFNDGLYIVTTSGVNITVIYE